MTESCNIQDTEVIHSQFHFHGAYALLGPAFLFFHNKLHSNYCKISKRMLKLNEELIYCKMRCNSLVPFTLFINTQ